MGLSAEKRHRHILEALDLNGRVHVPIVAAELNVTEGPRTIQVLSSLCNAPPSIGMMFIGEGARAPAKGEEAEIQLAKGLRPSRIKPGLMQASSAVSEKGG